jgi:hypothetical protein
MWYRDASWSRHASRATATSGVKVAQHPRGHDLGAGARRGAGWRRGARGRSVRIIHSCRKGVAGCPLPRRGVREHDDVIYSACMTEMLEEAIQKIRKLPEADQDEAAAMLLSVASKNDNTVELDEGTRRAIREGREQALEGKFVSDKDMAAFFRRHGVKRYQA